MIRFLFPTDVAMMWFAWGNIVQDDYFLCPGISEITAIQKVLSKLDFPVKRST